MTTRPHSSDADTPPPSRRGLLWGVAAAAALAGLGLAAWRGGLFARSAVPLAPGWWDPQWDSAQGEQLLLSSFKGRPLVINFWATWCAPCVEEMPLLDAFYRENKG